METRALPRLLAPAAFVAAVLAALLTAGCSAPGDPAPTDPGPGMPQPTMQTRPPSAPPSPSAPAAPAAESCEVTATSTGSISASGAGGSTSTINGRTSFSCGGGAMLAIDTIGGSGVTFVSEDGAATTIAPGTSGRAGGYTIEVARVDGGTAEFRVLQG